MSQITALTNAGVVQTPFNNTPPMVLINVIGDTAVSTNTYINEYSAMTIPPYWRAINFIAGTMAMLELAVHKDTGSSRARVKHPLNVLLTRKTSNYATPFKTFETWFHHGANWGNGYLWIKRNMAGDPVGLLNINTEITTPFIFEGEKYFYVNAQQPIVLKNNDVLHLAGIGFDGTKGYPPVQLLRQSLEVNKYAEKHTANYFKKGSFVRGSAEFPGALDGAQIAAIRESLQRFKGTDGSDALEVAILPFGGKFQNQTIPNETGQLLATREFSVEDVARITGVPPHILYSIAEKGAAKAIEQMGEEVVKYSLGTWIEKAQQEFTLKLLSEKELNDGLYIRYHTEALQRTDQAKFSTQMTMEVNGGVRTLNEARRELGLPPVGPEGDKLRIPVSFPTAPNGGEKTTTGTGGPSVPASPGASGDGTSAPSPGPGNTGAPAKDNKAQDDAVERGLPGVLITNPLESPANYSAVIDPLIIDAEARVEIKTQKAIDAKKGSEHYLPWLNVFAGQQKQYVLAAFAPIAKASIAMGRQIDVEKIASRYEASLKAQQNRMLGTIAKEIIYGNE
jgi:HK97 family phage portal protein